MFYKNTNAKINANPDRNVKYICKARHMQYGLGPDGGPGYTRLHKADKSPWR